MKTIKFIAIAALFLGFSVNAMAQNTANATASAGARIITHLSIQNTDSLQFGNIIASSAGGTVKVAPSAAATAEYSVGLAAPTGLAGTISSAKFTVAGETGAQYSITIKDGEGVTGEANKVTLSNEGGVNMVVNLVHNKVEAADKVISATAADNVIYVGGTLNVGGGQASGAYTGKFNVTVAYE